MSERAKPAAVPDATLPVQRTGRRWADLVPRILSGLVMVALALIAAIADGTTFALFWGAAAVAIQWEWQRMIGGGRRPLGWLLGALMLGVAALLTRSHAPGLGCAAIGLGMVATAAMAPARRLMAGAGVLYAGALAVSVILLREGTLGFRTIGWLFAVVWGTDIMAYVGGRLIGGPKLAARLSPSKTWAGFIVGVAAGAFAGLLVAPAGATSGAVVLVGLAAAALSQGGDIFESSLKRRYGVKDASHLIPGHGGVMDRLDGFIAATVFALLVGSARAGLDAVGTGLFNW